MTKDSITTQQIYELVDKKVSQVNASIVRLETKFDNLEQGRLSKLELEFANLSGKMAIVAGVVSVGISVAFVVLNKVIK